MHTTTHLKGRAAPERSASVDPSRTGKPGPLKVPYIPGAADVSSRTFSSLLVSTFLLSLCASSLVAQTPGTPGQISTVAGKPGRLPLALRDGEPAINSD